ncbi:MULTISPECIES: hypothetical protein [Kitasatospora]|uniref:Lipoprotein n=1 Tax=Kitasatospora setae (strain ATCC 33774 / DSM 43861 / JCM 3304 / KCC A-0304 / NBRC 14216 / KM-6054) TaxID=452652 RepID=E4MYZ5_KITSK|nr:MULTISPECIES: hypothetical protein [Kitasatospora]BAJ25888.1 hypothetical protein KSE_00360t [Kitasatospora setae KM-6054]BAJ33390.1 hypothetical protein KSE_76380t [Kitasatospora setae KM-6054]
MRTRPLSLALPLLLGASLLLPAASPAAAGDDDGASCHGASGHQTYDPPLSAEPKTTTVTTTVLYEMCEHFPAETAKSVTTRTVRASCEEPDDLDALTEVTVVFDSTPATSTTLKGTPERRSQDTAVLKGTVTAGEHQGWRGEYTFTLPRIRTEECERDTLARAELGWLDAFIGLFPDRRTTDRQS